MILFILKLFLAHILGDFVFQTDKWVKNKESKSYKSPYLYLHIVLHVIITASLLGFNSKYWLGILIIGLSHLTIDLIKTILNNKINARSLFIADQIAHITVLGIIVYMYFPFSIELSLYNNPQIILLIIALLLITSVSSILLKITMSKWSLQEDYNNDSLENAGKYIGILERLLVFGFIITEQWQAIGFLIAAKSVFRFSDLSRAKDRKLTEYILIGTLLSFGLAIIFGVCYEYVKSLI